jgi:hypothetical protein
MDMLPIDPMLTEEGAIAALSGVFGPSAAMPVPLEVAEDPFSSFQVVTGNLSVSTAAKLNIASIFGGSVNYNDKAYYFDAAAYTDKLKEGVLGDTVVFATRWGVGLRIALRVSDIKTELSGNFGAVAAAVELGAAKARYEIRGLGLGIDGLVIVLDSLSTLADFNYDTYYKVNTQVLKNLADYIRANKATLKAVPIAAALTKPLEVDPVVQGKSVLYAVTMIKDRRSLGDALRQGTANYDEQVIRRVYQTIIGEDVTDTTPIADEPRQRAQAWLRV